MKLVRCGPGDVLANLLVSEFGRKLSLALGGMKG